MVVDIGPQMIFNMRRMKKIKIDLKSLAGDRGWNGRLIDGVIYISSI